MSQRRRIWFLVIAILAPALIFLWVLEPWSARDDVRSAGESRASESASPTLAARPATAPGGAAPGSAGPAPAPSGDERWPATLPSPRGTIEVQLVHEGRPVPDVALRFHATAVQGPWSHAHADATSDATGRARVELCAGASLELTDPAWRLERGQRIPVAGGGLNFVPVVPLAARHVILRGDEGPLHGWRVTYGSMVAGSQPFKTDREGRVAMPRRQPLPVFMPVALDAHFHLFSLQRLPANGAVLRVPRPRYRTYIRVRSRSGALPAGGRVYLALPRFGLAQPLDDEGGVVVDYGMKHLPVTVFVPGYFPRLLSLQGEPDIDVQLAPTGSQRFRFVDARGRPVADGTKITVILRGPEAYPPAERPRPTAQIGTTKDGWADIPGLPLGPVHVRVHAQGPGVHAIRHLRLDAGTNKLTTVTVAPGRRVRFEVREGRDTGDGEAAAGVLNFVLEPGDEHGFPHEIKFRELAKFIWGTYVPWPFWVATVLTSRGPTASLEVPSSDRDVSLHVVRMPDWIGDALIEPSDAREVIPIQLTRVAVDAPDDEKRPKLQARTVDGAPVPYGLLRLEPREGGKATLTVVTDGNGDVWMRTGGTYDVWATTQDGKTLHAASVFLEPGRETRIELREP